VNDLNLSLLTQETLRVLCHRHGPVTATEMARHLGDSLHGAVCYGDVYVSLMRLVKAGLVETRCDRIGQASRIFWPTPTGRDLQATDSS
jgi:DNA-binding PadR family transcriptional regulator